MIATRPELFAVLRQCNPWWAGGRFPDLPAWRRAAFREIAGRTENPPAGRALLLSGARQVGKTTVASFIDLLEATHLIHRLRPFGYGKQILRARPKIYLADAAIAPSVLLKGKGLLEDPDVLARAVETAFFKHVFTRYYARSVGFSYCGHR